MSPKPRELSYAEARARVLAATATLPAAHEPVARAAGRALRRDLVAPHALPPFDNSAMDGWAVRAADTANASPTAPVTLAIVGVSAAGRPLERVLAPGQAALVMTGAPLPPGADAVVPFEEGTRTHEGERERAELAHAARLGAHIRRAGEDIPAGEVALHAGRTLSAHDLALAASLGFAEVELSPAPRVAVLSTGDELLDPSQPLRPGAIRDSNLPMLARLAVEAGSVVTLAERLPDDAARVTARVREALEVSDVVLTIGGVSAGDFDPVKQALDAIGEVELWRVAMRPGRPQAFGTPGGRLFFGLPGNPASVACVFEALVRPALRRLQGHAVLDRPRVPVRLASEVESREGRTDFVRCELEWRLGALWAIPAGAQVSGHLTPQSRAHALVVVPEEAGRLQKGDEAEALLLRMPDA
ncbi:MAG: molybdopterin molybdotransferase MoeA [Candidatus Eisenbacteria bacterium]|uniref:Molybdopterin molybdenumtransferase n=1 Tax=Eiseniibacteriota bacterium TaxID=2212470 RepID=A0A933SCU5_UNCEI|nr:molybdopterin molybdotransferase MoeA [Candidatus Eisenbacteria bacterium]